MTRELTENIYKLIFLFFLVFLPFVSFGLSIGNYKFTVSDFFLLLMLGFGVRFTKGIVLLFLLLLVPGLLSLINSVSYADSLVAVLPYFYGFVLFSILGYYLNHKWFISFLALGMLAALILSILPAYLFFITGLEIGLMDYFGGRYTFYSTNPNQIACFFLLSFFSLSILVFKYFRRYSVFLFALLLLLFLPIVLTGSQTITIAYFIFLPVSFFLFVQGLKKRLFFVVIGAFLAFFVLRKHIGNKSLLRAISYVEVDALPKIVINEPTMLNYQIRKDQVLLGVAYWKENPFFGVGLGTFDHYHTWKIHNLFFSILTETGLLGLCCLLLFFIIVLTPLSQSKSSMLFLGSGMILVFLLINMTHFYFRERWSWLFLFLLFKLNNDGKTNHFYNRWLWIYR